PVMCNNSVLPGQYADPDIDYFDGKFWIFPTTDGYPGWSGTVFHAWSSEDMVSWQDEGIIMELANDDPGENEKGIQIASSDWAVRGSAWAPSIEKKNDKYYFYYCGKDSNGTSQIGVASADRPEGPYTDLGTPLITVEKCRELGIGMGQAIDPSVFTDDDGTSYITFGNGNAAIVELGSDMMSIDESSMRQINGLTDFRESVVVMKRDGMYHWTWTCDDANSPNYHVNYGVSDTLDGNITVIHKPLLAKNENLGILGTGHQSMLHVQDEKGNDRYYIAYHRFYTPVDIFQSGDGLGVHRETCIDEVTFDDDGYMNIVHPSHEGATIYTVEEPPVNEPVVTPTPPSGTQTPPDTGVTPTDTPKNTAKPKPVVKLKGKSSVKKGKSITVKVKVTNPNGSKVKWSLDKKGKKLFKIVKKTQAKVKLKAKKKKGTGKITVKYGNIK
ncbi:MAG: family 43 glycosylhydrolase, partial [Lachnospiraceae bacterium]|nr:family 43 glycosylhydrolase [Lachnospiraceae bacterium]